jgi:hypothetical protein
MLKTFAVIVLAVASTGCKTKSRYSPSCKSSVALTAPWTELALPTGDGRVCTSDAKRVEMQYLTKHAPEWEKAYADALVKAGYAKDRCTQQSCTFVKADDKVTVQVIETRSWITVIARK